MIMKKIILLFSCMLLGCISLAAQSVTWSATSSKVQDGLCSIEVKAVIKQRYKYGYQDMKAETTRTEKVNYSLHNEIITAIFKKYFIRVQRYNFCWEYVAKKFCIFAAQKMKACPY